jgi:hypothetical protein
LSRRRNSTQKVAASEAPIGMPSTSRRPSVLTATAMVTATENDAPGLAHLHVGGVDQAPYRPSEEGLHALVDLGAQTRNLAFGDADHAEGLDQFIDRAGFPDDGRERLLGDPSRLQEARKASCPF